MNLGRAFSRSRRLEGLDSSVFGRTIAMHFARLRRVSRLPHRTTLLNV